MKLLNQKYWMLLMILAIALSACRGRPFDHQPLNKNENMAFQARVEAHQPSTFFEDGRAMREPVPGTVARGYLEVDSEFIAGVDEDGEFVQRMPVNVNLAMLKRGQERYDIYCQPCHGGAGFGDGIIIDYGYPLPTSFYDPRVLDMPDGELYSAIYNGIRNMPAYRHQIPDANDRWAIVAYIRALQLSQNATEQDLQRLGLSPEDVSAAANGGQGSNSQAFSSN